MADRLEVMAKNDERENAPQRRKNSPQIICKGCGATVELHTVIAKFGDQPESQVYVCGQCDHVEMVSIK
jgi:DNA-directed RNA polymerase subunit M/transcription elongation factor TFIIS